MDTALRKPLIPLTIAMNLKFRNLSANAPRGMTTTIWLCKEALCVI